MTTEHYRKGVSDADIERLCGAEIAQLMACVVPRTPCAGASAIEPGHGEAEPQTGSNYRVNPGNLTSETVECLESILEKPNLTSTQRRDELGCSTYKFDQLKKRLLAMGLAEELAINFGTAAGGICKFLELTERGCAALEQKPGWKRPAGMSGEHWWWQRNLADWYRAQGLKAEIETCLNGKRADVGFIKDGLKVAIEVGLTAKNEVVNVQKDLEAGFDRVLVACRDAKVRKAVEESLQRTVSPDKLERVKLIMLSDFSFVKEILENKPGRVKSALQGL